MKIIFLNILFFTKNSYFLFFIFCPPPLTGVGLGLFNQINREWRAPARRCRPPACRQY
jgi:hypothetical protein